MACGLTESIFRLEVVGDVKMPGSSWTLWQETVVSGEQEPCVE